MLPSNDNNYEKLQTENFKNHDTMKKTVKLSRLFIAAAIIALAALASTSCINDMYDLETLDTEMTLTPGFADSGNYSPDAMNVKGGSVDLL